MKILPKQNFAKKKDFLIKKFVKRNIAKKNIRQKNKIHQK